MGESVAGAARPEWYCATSMTRMNGLAADAYRQLKSDPGQALLLEAIDRALDRLEADPTDPALSRRVLEAEAIWGGRIRVIEVRSQTDDYWVGWQPTEDGRPRVVYLGPPPSQR